MTLTQTTRRLREDSGPCPAAAQVRVPGKVCPTASRAAQRLGHAPSLQFCDPAAVSSQTLADPSIERFRLRTWARIDVPRQPAAVSSGNLAVPSREQFRPRTWAMGDAPRQPNPRLSRRLSFRLSLSTLKHCRVSRLLTCRLSCCDAGAPRRRQWPSWTGRRKMLSARWRDSRWTGRRICDQASRSINI